MEKQEPSYTAGGNVTQCSCFGEESSFPQKVKDRGTRQNRNYTLTQILRRNENIWSHKNCILIFTAALFSIVKKNPKMHQLMINE